MKLGSLRISLSAAVPVVTSIRMRPERSLPIAQTADALMIVGNQKDWAKEDVLIVSKFSLAAIWI